MVTFEGRDCCCVWSATCAPIWVLVLHTPKELTWYQECLALTEQGLLLEGALEGPTLFEKNMQGQQNGLALSIEIGPVFKL